MEGGRFRNLVAWRLLIHSVFETTVFQTFAAKQKNTAILRNITRYCLILKPARSQLLFC